MEIIIVVIAIIALFIVLKLLSLLFFLIPFAIIAWALFSFTSLTPPVIFLIIAALAVMLSD